ncbi:MAG: flagellar biosynthesis protein FlhB [Spirochaetes bacterium]|nr:MAG: flagellar biosynthesis protein FlhB [Spirochaetota bacterium]
MKKAIALEYREDLPAPFILAKGQERMAERLVEIARENEIEILPMPELTDSLFTLQIGDWIPEEFYRIVAELLVFIYKVRNEK